MTLTPRDRYDSTTNKWYDRVKIMSLFHMQQTLNDSTWHVADTASYFSIGVSTVSENLQIANRFDEMKSCGSRNKALKKLRGIL